ETTADQNFHAFGTLAERVLHDALHGATEHHTALQLLRDVDRDQLRIEIRLADFLDVDLHRYTHANGQILAQLIDVLTLLADNDTGAGSVDRDTRGLSRALDQNAADRSACQLLLQVFTHLQIVDQ